MTRSQQHPWLSRFAWMAAAATFLLLGLGGLVTSKEAGMAVPDWPTTYGYNMFLFPIHLWTGGVFYEHSHRLFASLVGFLTLILAGWVWWREPRRWLRWLAIAALLAVILQGVLGGLRVTLYKDEIGIFHATLAQLFFVAMTVLAAFLSGFGERVTLRLGQVPMRHLALVGSGAFLILTQLVLGATMRHEHAGLAVPDFPLAYGRIWPPTDNRFVEQVNQRRVGAEDYKPITASQIVLHMTHRITAVVILLTVAAAAWSARQQFGAKALLSKWTLAWFGLLLLQGALGAATVWTNKAADIATAHVLGGALSLVTGGFLLFCLAYARRSVPAAARASTNGFKVLGRLPQPESAA